MIVARKMDETSPIRGDERAERAYPGPHRRAAFRPAPAPSKRLWAVSLTHEQALAECDPKLPRPEALLQILRGIAYTIHDPTSRAPWRRKSMRSMHEGRHFLVVVAFSLLATALIAFPRGPASA
ncbi:hypothetical protein U879_21170 [Defluviimonas sp. 20V17]|uniref:Uncharacterized protein n=2 Tax=Allgaiera indica TaxID=765699 RepID=A0AAN4UT25_9RHOB|nr:hypothetical protein U879_21170 [Defluviimonas sp. 20V17]GHE03966.1 hypothetical protein GCM10008024_29270 [Allgaiera indica]